ncbi:MAG: F0F1 ATP synthase subunit A [Desulfobulbaceae bacterium DB1]|nr:MAG: F0F1 ATP synthase subunit A [Desulfobulbaceae bacterium DB1]
MKFSPDQFILIEWGWGHLNATILFTWLEMFLLVGGSWLITRKLGSGMKLNRRQNLLEILVGGIANHIEEITRQKADPFLPFVGTLFLFILLSNILAVIPFYPTPTASLSTTSALAFCVFIAVPVFGLSTRSLGNYLGEYIKPSPFMLPFNLLGDISRTFALAVRLYGNLMSGSVVGFVLLLIVPFFFPVVMSALGLLTGTIQAYIFALLAMIYIASMLKNKEVENGPPTQSTK